MPMIDILGRIDEKIEFNSRLYNIIEKMYGSLWKLYFNQKNQDRDSIGNVVLIKYGKNLPTSLLRNEGFVVFGGNGPIGFYSSYMYETPKVLVSCRGAASGNVIYSYPKSFITNNSLILEDNEKIRYSYLRGLAPKIHFEKYSTGSAQPQITIDNISSIEIPIPTVKMQICFEKEANPLLLKLEQLRESNEVLQKLKSLYLQKFFG